MSKKTYLYRTLIAVVMMALCFYGCKSTEEKPVKYERVDSLACSRYTYDAIARLASCTTEKLYDYSESKLCDAAKSISLAKMCCGNPEMISSYEEAQREIINAHTILANANDSFHGTNSIDISRLVDSIDIDLLIDFYDSSDNVIHPMSPQEVLYMGDFYEKSSVHIKKAILILYDNYERIKPKNKSTSDQRQKIDW